MAARRLAPLLLAFVAVQASRPVDIHAASQYLIPTAKDTQRSTAFLAQVRSALRSPTCRRHPDVLVLDAGGGGMTRLVASAAVEEGVTVAIAAIAPAHAPELVSAMWASLRQDPVPTRGPLACFPSPRALEEEGGGVKACVVVVDAVPKFADVSAGLLWTLAQAVARDFLAPGAVTVPSALTVHGALLEAPTLRNVVVVDGNATMGVELGPAFDTASLPSTAGWVSGKQVERATLTHRMLTPPRGAVFKVPLVDVATSIAAGKPYVAHKDTVLQTGGRATAVNFWTDLVLAKKRAGKRSAVLRGGSPQAGSVPPHSPHMDDVVVPWITAGGEFGRWLDVGDSVTLRLEVGSDCVMAVSVAEGGTKRPRKPVESFPLWHISMVNDRPRNLMYAAAIQAAVAAHVAATGEAPHVLDVGAGAGLLTMLAANAGAGHVSAIEADPPVAARLQTTVAMNNATAQVSVFATHSTQVFVQGAVPVGSHGEAAAVMPRKADVVVHEIFDGSVTGEGVVPSLADALTRLAVPGAVVIPAAVTVQAIVVSCSTLAAWYRTTPAATAAMPSLATFDLQDVQYGVALNQLQYTALTPVVDIVALDLSQPVDWEAVTLEAWRGAAVAPGPADAVVMWFTMVEGGVRYSTSPWDMPSATHWTQMAQVLPGAAVRAGDAIGIQPYVALGGGGFRGVRFNVTL